VKQLFSDRRLTLNKNGAVFHGSFIAFESQCELLIETSDQNLAKKLLDCISKEAIRISDKYSLSNPDNIMSRINRGTADSIIVDEETAGLIDFADICFHLSEGRFDSSCFALQPDSTADEIIKKSGWHKIRWDRPRLRLLQGMKLNFSAFAKEHACDRCMALAHEVSNQVSEVPILINLGGNILVNKPRQSTGDWWIEQFTTIDKTKTRSLQIKAGGICTAYTTDPVIYFDGRNCQPIENTPQAITVMADSCTEAGMLATLAILYGDDAEYFLQKQQANYQINN